MARGERIAADRRIGGTGPAYSHVGIDMGDGTVVHARPHRFARLLGSGGVVRTSLAEFAGGEVVRVVSEPPAAFPPEEVAARAERHVGRHGYSVVIDNCEHFATWCATGRRASRQIDILAGRVGRMAARAAGAVGARTVADGAAQVAVRTAVGTTARVGLRSFVPAVLAAEGVAMAVEWKAHRAGRDEQACRHAADAAGMATSAAIFAAAAAVTGPAGLFLGACTGAAIWAGTGLVSRASTWAGERAARGVSALAVRGREPR